jgi:hypothetical protein
LSDLHVPAVRLRRPSWRDSRLLIGVLIVLASVAIGARVVAAADDSVPVFAAASALPSGHAITAADLRVVRVHLDGGVAGYLSARSGVPADLVSTRPVGAGELIPSAAVGPASALTRRPVAVPMPAPLPAGLKPGAAVDVWASAKQGGTASSGYLPPTRIAQGVEVYAISAAGGGLAAATGDSVQILLEEGELRALLDALANGAKVAVVPAPALTDDGRVPQTAQPAAPAPTTPASTTPASAHGRSTPGGTG